jgi:hypothetical protein
MFVVLLMIALYHSLGFEPHKGLGTWNVKVLKRKLQKQHKRKKVLSLL